MRERNNKKMIDFKEIISKEISRVINFNNKKNSEVINMIEIPKEKEMGDYAFPCFKLAKTLRKSPQIIAEEINKEIKIDENIIEKKEIVGRLHKFLYEKRNIDRKCYKRI